MASSDNKFESLEDICRRKEEICMELENTKTIIVSSTRCLFSPPPAATNSTQAFMRNLGTGLVILNGVKSGMKFVGIIKSFLKRHK